MSRANPFGNLDDFAAPPSPKPVPAEAIEEIAQASGFPSRKARTEGAPSPAPAAPAKPAKREKAAVAPPPPNPAPAPVRQPRRRTTGRNQQINIKATEETITALYRIADELDLPLGAVLERALAALEQSGGK
ncbi:hypothetical protein [Novosphingobium kaempferiae]|uniref:hypothetical protein n=1 Tax=Novosphingobium kaempferiae TaxID=2896849 RepID=UPI001E42BD94|nr:hypothetical protein [Novosphingobium kaempferiae]